MKFPITTISTLAILIAASHVRASAAEPAKAAPARPNIILVLLDDLGSADVGFQGSKDIRTPHIDRLATSGVRFTSAYANGPVCTPTRAALISGAYQNRFGIEDIQTSPTNVLPGKVDTVAERLRAVGYRTGHLGKWHLGDLRSEKPPAQGFEEVSGKPIPLNLSPDRTVNLSLQAVNFIEREDSRPFFLFLAHTVPHIPVTATQEQLARYPDIADGARRAYAASVSVVDDGVGLVLAAVEKSGKLANTLVIFTSDNGGPTTRSGVNGSSNAPLRGSKHETFEGGIRVPLAMSWPGGIPAGGTFDSPVITFDLTATALAIGGADTSKTDGVNLLPFLADKKAGPVHEALFWRLRNYGQHAVRRGDWKYVRSSENFLDPAGTFRNARSDPPSRISPPRDMLFNLADDPGEARDLATARPEILAELKQLYQTWSDKMDADWRAFREPPR